MSVEREATLVSEQRERKRVSPLSALQARNAAFVKEKRELDERDA